MLAERIWVTLHALDFPRTALVKSPQTLSECGGRVWKVAAALALHMCIYVYACECILFLFISVIILVSAEQTVGALNIICQTEKSWAGNSNKLAMSIT